MNIKACAILSVLLSACVQDTGPPVSIVATKIMAPMPGSSAGVAYFTIENRSNESITVDRIESPQYNDVQMHETIIDNGVSRMRPVKSFQVGPASSVEFSPGGKHVMLMKPSTNLTTGSSVTLEIHYDTGLLIISAAMQDRLPDL